MATKTKSTDAKTYAKNILTSAKYITSKTIQGINPTLTQYVQDTKEDAKDLFQEAKNYKNNIRSKIKDITSSESGKYIKNIRRNIIDDLKSGKLYNPDREDEASGDIAKSLGFDFDFDMDELDKDVNESNSFNDQIKNSIDNIGDKISANTNYALGMSSSQIASNATSNTQRSMRHNSLLVGSMNNSLAAINGSILNLHKSFAEPLNTHIINSTNYFKTSTEELAKQTHYLENLNKLLSDRFNPKSTFGTGSQKRTDWESVMGNGLPSLKEWAHVATARIKDNNPLSMMGGLFDSNMIGAALGSSLASPIANGLAAGLSFLIGKGPTGKALNNVAETLKGGFSYTAGRIHERSKKGGLLGSLASLFDIIPNANDKVNFGDYNKGSQPWTGKDSKALMEVIPGQLAEIISLISGKPAKLFNYERGKFMTASGLLKDFEESRSRNINMANHNFKDEIINKFISEDTEQNNGIQRYEINSRAIRSLGKDYDTLMYLLTTKNVNPSQFTQRGQIYNYARQNKWIGNFIDAENLKKIDRLIFSSKGSIGKLSSAYYSGIISDNRFMSNSQNMTYAQTLKDYGSDITNADKAGNIIASSLDDKGNNVFFYLQDYYKTLRTIEQHIASGQVRAARKDGHKVKKPRSIMDVEIPINNRQPEQSTEEIIDSEEDIYKSDQDPNGTQVYNSRTNKYEAPRAASRFTTQHEEKRETATSKAVDKINNLFEDIFFGNPVGRFKDFAKQSINGTGLWATIKAIPDIIKRSSIVIGDKIKDAFKALINNVKNSKWVTDFKGTAKESIKNFGKSSWNYAKRKVSDIHYDIFGHRPSWDSVVTQTEVPNDIPKEANPEGAYKGGMVRKSGMASVSEGEMIIPAKYNPYYHGHLSDSDRQLIERTNYRNWLADGGNNNDFFGFFRKGSDNVTKNPGTWERLSKNIKNRIAELYSQGYSAEDIAKEVKHPIGQVNQYIKSLNRKGKAKVAAENIKETTEKVKSSKFGQKVSDLTKSIGSYAEKGMKFLFGDAQKYDRAKDTTKEAVNTIKSSLPKTLLSGGIGAILGGALTGSKFGLLGGLVLGVGTSIIKNSESIQKKLFGEYDANSKEWKGGKIPSKVTKFIKERLPDMAKGGTIGAILGTLGIAPGGLFGGLALGAGLELVSTTNVFKDAIFGKPDVNGKRNGGLMGVLKTRIINPLVDFVQGGITKLKNWFGENLFNPAKKLLSAGKDLVVGKVKKTALNIRSRVKDKVKRTFAERFDATGGRVIGFGGKIVSGAWKAAKGIASLPGKAMEGLANKIERRNIRTGYSSKTAQERMAMEGQRYGILEGLFVNAKAGLDNVFDKTKELLFGPQNRTGKRHGGLFGKLHDAIFGGNKSKGLLQKLKESTIDPIAKFVKEQTSNLKKWILKHILEPLKKRFKESRLGQFLDKKKDQAKNWIKDKKDKITDAVQGKIIDPTKAFLSKSKNFLKDKWSLKNSAYTKWAAEEGRTDQDILEAYYYTNGKSALVNERTKKRQGLADTVTASLTDGGMGDPKLVKDIKRLFNSKEVRNNDDYSKVIEKIQSLTPEQMGEESKKKLLDMIESSKSEFASNREKEAAYDANQDAFFKKLGLTSEDEIVKFMKAARVQSSIDADKISKGKLDQLMADIGTAKSTDDTNKLLKIQEKENPLDAQRNQLISKILDTLNSIKDRSSDNDKDNSNPVAPSQEKSQQLLQAPISDASLYSEHIQNQKKENTISHDNVSTPVEVTSSKEKSQYLLPAPRVNKLLSEQTEPNEGDRKTETDASGHSVEYVYHRGEWAPDESDASTNKAIDEANEDRTLRNKFFTAFTEKGGLLASFKGLFHPDDKTGEKSSLWEKIKGFGSKIFGDDGIFGKIFSALGGKAGLSGLFSKVLLPGLAAILGFNIIKKIGDKSAGTGKDSGMNASKDPEERKAEVAKMNGLQKFNLGLDSLENTIRKRDTTTYKEDDFVTEYESSRFKKRIALNLLESGNPQLAKAGANVVKKTFGKLGPIGKAAGAPFQASASGITGAKNVVAKVKDIGIKVSNTKAGQTVASKAKSLGEAVKKGAKAAGETKAGKAIVGAFDKLKQKIKPVFDKIGKLLGIKDASALDDAAEQVAKGIAGNAGEKLTKLLAKVGLVLYIAQIALAVEDGLETARAKVILGILDTPTFGQRLLSAACNGINAAIPGIGGIIPTEVLFNIVYTVLKALGINFGNFDKQRQEAKEAVAAYNAQEGTTYNLEEYIHNVLGEYTTQEKIKKFAKETVGKAWNATKEAVGKTWSGLKDSASKAKEARKEIWSDIKSGNIGTAFKKIVKGEGTIRGQIKKKVADKFAASKLGQATANLKQKISDKFTSSKLGQATTKLKDNIKDAREKAKEARKDIWSDIKSGNIKNAFTKIIKGEDSVSGQLGKKISNKIKESKFGQSISSKIDYVKDAHNALQTMEKKMETLFNAKESSIKDVIAIKAEASPENPLAGITKTIGDIQKIVIVPKLFIKGIGEKIYKKTIKPIVEGIKKLAKDSNVTIDKARQAAKEGDFEKLYSNTAEISEDTPLGGIVKVANAGAKVVLTPLTAICWVGKKIKEVFNKAKEKFIAFTKTAQESRKVADEFKNAGDIKGLWKMDSDADSDNPAGFASTVTDFGYKMGMTIPTLFNALGNVIKNVFDKIKKKMQPIVDTVKISKTEAERHRKNGDLKGLWKMTTIKGDDKENPLRFLPKVTDTMYKVTMTIPTMFTALGNKITEVFNTAKASMPDCKELIPKLWSYSDPSTNISEYNEIVNSEKTDNSGIFGAIGRGLTSLVGGIMKPIVYIARGINSVINFIPNLFSKIGDKVKNVFSNIGDWFDDKADAVKDWMTADGSGIHTSQRGNYRSFGNGTIDQNGCGPASASTVLKAYGRNVNLDEAAKYATKHNYVAGSSGNSITGTRADYFNDIFNKNGIDSEYIRNRDLIRSAIASGNPTVLLGQNPLNKSKNNSPFGPNPHYVVARGTDDKDNIKIDDPELKNSTWYNKDILNDVQMAISTKDRSVMNTSSSNIPMYDFASQVIDKTKKIITSKELNKKSISDQSKILASYNKKLDAIIDYMALITTNTGYNKSLPTIIDILSKELKLMSAMVNSSSADSDASEDVVDSMNRDIAIMMQKLEAISQSL